MGEDQELKHVCKFCSKSFSCGRSLGGHMRSHMINSPDGSSKKKQLPPLINGNLDTKEYVLRENPKKTSKFGDDHDQDQSSEEEEEEDTLLPNQNNNKVCKECGKSFQSWKALFGHMKCHSSLNNSVEQDDDDSWNSGANANLNHSKQLLLDSQSDTEAAAAAAPNKKKRSSRRVKRYIAATTSSSLTVNASPCVSEIEHELQEEVAMSLILLSRDMGNWVGQNHVTTEFSDNNSHFLKKVKNGKTEQVEKREKPEFLGDDEKKKKIRVDNECDVEFASNSEKKLKFECTTCYKSFNSYQALGGHRVSHKSIKGKNSSSIEIEHLKNGTAINEKIETNKKMHECPICFKVFSSGQALGGHKRSHLIAEAKRNNNNHQAATVELQKPIPETRNFLDLNLPAPVEEDNMLDSNVGFQQWWLESTHKHEQLLGL